MPESRETHLGRPCDICGDFGFVESLSTCFQCNIVCEHTYCMQTNLRDVPKVWFCEACQSNDGIVSPESGAKERLLKASISNPFGIVSQGKKDSNALFPSKMVCQDAMCSVGPSILSGDTRMWVPCEKQRAFETAKINFLPAEEAVMLLSGAITKASPLKGGMGSRTGPSDTLHSISRSPVVSTTATPKSILKKGNSNPSSRPSGHSKPRTLGRVQTRSTTLQQRAVQNSKPLKDEKSPLHFVRKRSGKVLPQTNVRSIDAKLHSPLKLIGGTEPKSGIDGESYEGGELGLDKAADTVDSPLRKEIPAVSRKDYVCKEDPIDAVMSGKEVGTSNTKTDRAVYKALCASSPPTESPSISNSGGTFCTDAKPNNFDVQERDLPRVLPLFEKHLPNPPSIDTTWKGSFEILNTVSPSKFYDGFRAHPPVVVSHKAYEFSKQMPGVLQFKLQPRCDIWAELFQTDCPDGHDIALYYFPGDFERSKQMYDCLLGLIEMHDLVMRSCCFDGVELLIFSSKHLHADSQRLNMQFYLWGVYRRLKGNKAVHKEHGLPSSSVSEVVDMEIDKIGGNDVGRVDKPVSRHLLQGNEVQFNLQVPAKSVQFKPQGLLPSANNLDDLYKNTINSYEIGYRSTWGEASSSDHSAEPPLRDVISQVHIHRPNEGPGSQHLPEVKREQINDPGFPPGFY